MLKRLLFMLTAALLLTACGSDTDTAEKPKEVEKRVEVKKETELAVSESKVSFTDFTIEIEDAKIKDGKLILNTRYYNDSYEEPRAFGASAGVRC